MKSLSHIPNKSTSTGRYQIDELDTIPAGSCLTFYKLGILSLNLNHSSFDILIST